MIMMVVTHKKYLFRFYFLLTIHSVFTLSVCPAGQYWDDSADACLPCGLICQHADLTRTEEKCIVKCPGYTPAPPVTSSSAPLQQTGTSVPFTVSHTQSTTTIVLPSVAIFILLIVVVVVWILVRYRPSIIPVVLCGYRSQDQDTELGLPKYQQSLPGAANDEQRRSLLEPLPTEESFTSASDINNHTNPQQDLSAQCDALGCSGSDTLVKVMEGSVPQPMYDLDETVPKSQVFSETVDCMQEEPHVLLKKQEELHLPGSTPYNWSNNYHVNELHDVGTMFRSILHQEEPDTLPKEEDKQQTPGSKHSNGLSTCLVDVPYDQLPKQSSPSCCVQGQSVLLLPGGQTYPMSDHIHDKVGVQVQDGSGDYEESILHVLNNTQPVTQNPGAANFSTHLPIYVSHINQAVVNVLDNETCLGAIGTHGRIVQTDRQYASPIVLSQLSVRQSPDLKDVPSSSSMMHHHHVTQSPCQRDLTVPMNSMPTLPPFIEQADSFI
ncbi:hypothetical protein CHS0354_000371 [Potamilus streckersoni]|uniref:Uncharacterized protein n=1 Tax=Potamilus streckersoni TaxID=2493646 RepID=A0AAE0WEB2_9BIVA|nr:hypothetical protein CHS0354_000371 [Potamilus streckersoni]